MDSQVLIPNIALKNTIRIFTKKVPNRMSKIMNLEEKIKNLESRWEKER